MVGLALLSSVAVLPAQLAALGDRVEGARMPCAAVTASLPPGAATVVDAATRMEQELPPAAAEPGDGTAA
ncbi:hypothetical protein ACFRCI_35635 [Streptomyces sp. NPDC056638]|uniref:hypothetical protein n=1 Tax=Streptomyces sp. NPDC056638 TaxID=3345887 RepID=UPI003694D8E9